MAVILKPELLAPAGDFEKVKCAFHFGADAVYVGLKDFSLRANTKNFNEEEIKQAIEYAHDLGKKVYIAFNIYFTPDQSNDIIKQLKFIDTIKPDGIIISDLGLLNLARKYTTGIQIHISTQANTTNQYAVEMYKNLGVSRIVLARELSLIDIKNIKDNFPDIELEAFVHGAMCISYSGRCLLSAYMTHNYLGKRKSDEDSFVRSANKGDCSHSCRWEFILKEKTRPDQNYEISQDEKGTYILSSKDICMINHIGDLIGSGVTSFKIEGRMKSILYISSIVRAYRQAIDHYFDNEVFFDKKQIENELNVVSHREFSTGFFYYKPMENANITESTVYKREMRLAALVENVNGNRAILKIYNTINSSDYIEYISRNMRTIKIGKIIFYNKEGNILSKVNHNQYVEAEILDENGNIFQIEQFDILRMESNF